MKRYRVECSVHCGNVQSVQWGWCFALLASLQLFSLVYTICRDAYCAKVQHGAVSCNEVCMCSSSSGSSSGSSGSNGRFCEVIGTRVLADSTSYLLAYKLQWLLSSSAFATTLRRSTDPACETAFGSNQSHPKPCFCDTFLIFNRVQSLKVMFCSILYQK